MPEFKLIEVAETAYLYAERTTSWAPDEIAAAMGSSFQEVWAFMTANAIAPRGGALSVYYTYDPEQMSFRAGFVIGRGDLGKAAGAVKGDVTPAGKVMHFTHKGSYATLRDDYDLMMRQLDRQRLKLGAPTWEVYMNDPSQVAEEDLLTEVYVSLA